MSRARHDLDVALRTLCSNVYFQPPENVKMKYPAIVYNRSDSWIISADNRPYIGLKGYEITYITKDPDSNVPDKLIEMFRNCRYDRSTTVDNLYHHYLTLFW